MSDNAPMALRPPVFALINLTAGNCDRDRLVELLSSAAQRAGVELEIGEAEGGKRKMTRAALDRGFRTVLAVGGDGTVSKMASEVFARGGSAAEELAVGVVPAGTGNLLATELGVPDSLEQAVEGVFGPVREQRLDGLELDDNTVFSHVSLGTYSRMADTDDTTGKKLFGKGFYLWRAFLELRRARRWRFEIVVDGKRFVTRASLVLLANIRPLGLGDLDWGEHIDPTDGVVDVCIVRAAGLRQYARLLLDSFRGRTSSSPHIDYLRAETSVVVRASEELPVRADGQVVGEREVEVRVRPGAVRLLIPEAGERTGEGIS